MRLVGTVDGISVDKRMILAPDKLGRIAGPSPARRRRARARTARVHLDLPSRERFLIGQFRVAAAPAAFGDWEAEWAVIRDAGVDGVFVDHPDLGVAFFKS